MSATISANKLKFTIFGSGNDYTRVNSGVGDMIFFSHPFVPLGSSVCAGQFLLYAPVYNPNDETAEPTIQDVVMNDMSHCTFTPALGSTFNTEGEVEVKLAYHREYVYDDTIITVDKELTQKITVVNHGTLASSDFTIDVYTDGYAFVRPWSYTVAEPYYYRNESNRTFKKLSSIPWRAYSLRGLAMSSGCEDIEELQYADVSNVTSMQDIFRNCTLTDLTPLKNWDVSKVTNLSYAFAYNTNGYQVVMEDNKGLVSLAGLENWNCKPTNISNMFYEDYLLEDISALSNWDMSSLILMSNTFCNCRRLADLKPLKKWDVSKVTDMSFAFTVLFSTYNFDKDFPPKLESLDGLEDWDVSSVTNFNRTFAQQPWLSDISSLANWDMSNGLNFEMMLYGLSVPNLGNVPSWDLSSATNMNYMFGVPLIRYSSSLDKDIYSLYYSGAGYLNLDKEGNSYTNAQMGTLTSKSHNASSASGWTVLLTNAGAFEPVDGAQSGWTNIPSWN